jgi:hypothetical protein
MKQLMYGNMSVLVGDDIAEVLLEYAAQVARSEEGDSVDARSVGADGKEVMVTFSMGEGVPVTETVAVETSTTQLPEPDNTDLEVRLHSEIARRRPAWMDAPDPLEDPEVIADAESWARRHRN